MSKLLKERWVAIGGSIYTENDQHPLKIDHTGEVKRVRKSIAFNVGEDIAQHIVDLHNLKLIGELIRRIDLNLATPSEVRKDIGL